ncbi:acyl-coenzyme A thioesterase 13, partial [Tremellales sp. Uapishka_1]
MIAPSTEQQDQFKTVLSTAPFGSALASSLRLASIDPPPASTRNVEGYRVYFEGTVEEGWTNYLRTLHGAAAAWLVDTWVSSNVSEKPPARDGFWDGKMLAGVSLSINMEYLNPAPLGTALLIKCEVLKCSKAIANIRCEIVDAADGKIYAAGTHIKMWKDVSRAKL